MFAFAFVENNFLGGYNGGFCVLFGLLLLRCDSHRTDFAKKTTKDGIERKKRITTGLWQIQMEHSAEKGGLIERYLNSV